MNGKLAITAMTFAVMLVLSTYSSFAEPTYNSSVWTTNGSYAFDDDFSAFAQMSYYWTESLSNNSTITFFDYVGSNSTYSFNVSGRSGTDNNMVYSRLSFWGYNYTNDNWTLINRSDINSNSIINGTVVWDNPEEYVNDTGYVTIQTRWECYEDDPIDNPCGARDASVYEIWIQQPEEPVPDQRVVEQYPIVGVIPLVMGAVLLAIIGNSILNNRKLDLGVIVTAGLLLAVGIALIGIIFTV